MGIALGGFSLNLHSEEKVGEEEEEEAPCHEKYSVQIPQGCKCLDIRLTEELDTNSEAESRT